MEGFDISRYLSDGQITDAEKAFFDLEAKRLRSPRSNYVLFTPTQGNETEAKRIEGREEEKLNELRGQNRYLWFCIAHADIPPEQFRDAIYSRLRNSAAEVWSDLEQCQYAHETAVKHNNFVDSEKYASDILASFHEFDVMYVRIKRSIGGGVRDALDIAENVPDIKIRLETYRDKMDAFLKGLQEEFASLKQETLTIASKNMLNDVLLLSGVDDLFRKHGFDILAIVEAKKIERQKDIPMENYEAAKGVMAADSS